MRKPAVIEEETPRGVGSGERSRRAWALTAAEDVERGRGGRSVGASPGHLPVPTRLPSCWPDTGVRAKSPEARNSSCPPGPHPQDGVRSPSPASVCPSVCPALAPPQGLGDSVGGAWGGEGFA